MRDIDALRPLTAGRLLTIWRESRREAEDPLERSLLSNAQVLAECCLFQGEAAFRDREDVLGELTAAQMEGLLEQLSSAGRPGGENPAFDMERFAALREG